VQQQVAASIVFSSLLLIVVSLPPHNTRPERALALATVGFIILLAAISIVLSATNYCGPAALGFAHGVTVLSAFSAFSAYVPQLYDTWRTGGAGSLSPLFLMIQVAGCLLVNYNQIIANKDPPPVWLPTAVSGLMQAGVLSLVLYFRVRPRDDSAAMRLTSTPALPLLANEEAARRPADGVAAAPDLTRVQ